MIERLRIRNFQKHAKKEVLFDRQITSLIGATDQGKSTLVRALGWIAFNQPSGSEFIQWGTEFAWGELIVDGHSIIRKKGKGTNSYYLDGKEFKALGTGTVPEEIQKVLQLSSLNFQKQLDPPFWFTDSPGKVSKNLNQIVNLGTIDSTLTYLTSSLKKSKAKVELVEERLKEARESRNALTWVMKANRILSTLKKRSRQRQELQERIAGLSLCLETARTTKKALKGLSQLKKQGFDLVTVGDAILVNDAQQQALHSLIEKAQRADLRRNIPIPNAALLEEKLHALTKLEQQHKELTWLVQKAKAARQQKKLLCQQQRECEQEVTTRMQGTTCPVCGQLVAAT